MRIFPVTGLPEIREGDDLAALVTDRVTLEAGDVLVVAQKAVSKAEGRVVRLEDLEPWSDMMRDEPTARFIGGTAERPLCWRQLMTMVGPDYGKRAAA